MPIVEESQQPSPEGTNIEILIGVQQPQNQDAETLKEVQPENTEATLKFNGTTLNLEEAMELDKSQTTISDHPLEGMVEYVTGWPECYAEEDRKLLELRASHHFQRKTSCRYPGHLARNLSNNHSTTYTICGTGRTRPVGSYREAQILRPRYSRHKKKSGTSKEGILRDCGHKLGWRIN
jgi:hypothetical protein